MGVLHRDDVAACRKIGLGVAACDDAGGCDDDASPGVNAGVSERPDQVLIRLAGDDRVAGLQIRIQSAGESDEDCRSVLSACEQTCGGRSGGGADADDSTYVAS